MGEGLGARVRVCRGTMVLRVNMSETATLLHGKNKPGYWAFSFSWNPEASFLPHCSPLHSVPTRQTARPAGCPEAGQGHCALMLHREKHPFPLGTHSLVHSCETSRPVPGRNREGRCLWQERRETESRCGPQLGTEVSHHRVHPSLFLVQRPTGGPQAGAWEVVLRGCQYSQMHLLYIQKHGSWSLRGIDGAACG